MCVCVCEEVRKILNIAETFKIGEKELEEEERACAEKQEVEVEEEVEEKLDRLETKNEVVEKTVEAKEIKRDANSDDDDDDDDDFQILDVFGDDEPEVLKLTPEDEAKAKRKTIEASVVVGPVLHVEGTVGAAIEATKYSKKKLGAEVWLKNASAALVAPKALLAKMCVKEKWLAPRYDRLKTDDKKHTRYSATIERSSGPKYLRKPTILVQTISFEEKDGNEPDGGWKSVTEAQDAAACVALFRILFVEREMKFVVPSELNHQWRDYYRQSLLLRELFSGIDGGEACESSDDKTRNEGGDEEDWETFAVRVRKTLCAARTEWNQKLERELGNADKDADKAPSNSRAATSTTAANKNRERDSDVVKEKRNRNECSPNVFCKPFAKKNKHRRGKISSPSVTTYRLPNSETIFCAHYLTKILSSCAAKLAAVKRRKSRNSSWTTRLKICVARAQILFARNLVASPQLQSPNAFVSKDAKEMASVEERAMLDIRSEATTRRIVARQS